MAITVNLRYTGKDGAAQAFAREMISSGTVEKIRAEKGNLRYEYYLPFGEDDSSETILLIPKEIHRLGLWCGGALHMDSN